MYYMRQVISVSLDEDLKTQLDEIAQSKHLNKSFIIKEALRKYLFLENLNNTRKVLRPYAEKKGYFSDDDIYRDIS